MGKPDISSAPEKRCPDCGLTKPASDFWKSKNSPDGLAFYCKECYGKRTAQTYRRRQKKAGKATRPYRPLVQSPEGMKYCPQCEQVKSISEFGKNRSTKSGLTAYCKPCHNAAGRESKQRLYGGTRHYHIQHRYGISEAEVEEMIARQGGKCMICRTAPAEHVDHDHETGAVRGVLCFNCNGGLGQFKDRGDMMARAIAYLRGTLRPLPPEDLLDGPGHPVLTRFDDDTHVYVSPDYAHA